MSVAGGITLRNFMLLSDRRLAPLPRRAAFGKGVARSWDTFALGQVAIIGALHKAGAGLISAAKLAGLVAGEQGAAYGRFISGLDACHREKDFHAKYPDFPWLPTEKYPGDVRDDFWMHRYLRTLTDAYRPRTARKGDFLLEIIDQEYVFYGALHDLKFSYADGGEAEALCRITNWGRGDDVSIRTVLDEVGVPIGEARASQLLKKVEAEYFRARSNAISFVRVNMSLAIRTALDEVHEFREGRSDGK